MSFGFLSLVRRQVLKGALILAALCLGTSQRANALPDLIVTVGDTIAPIGLQNTQVSVFLQNIKDTVVGLNIWIQCDRPDIVRFQGTPDIRVDTTYWKCLTYQGPNCVDSVQTIPAASWDFIHIDTIDVIIGNFDTNGTLLDGWELVSAVSITGTATDINLVALADNTPIGGSPQPGLLPQPGITPLVKLLADVLPIPDTMQDRTVNLVVQYQVLDHISFSRPNGTSIGIAYQPFLDTNLFQCTSWAGETCLIWERTSTPPYDSIEVVPDSIPYVDTTKIIFNHGSVTIEEAPAWVCGNINNSNPPNVTVADLTYLVNFLFRGGPAPQPVLQVADVNCSGAVSVADISYMVNYLFRGGAAPCAGGC